MPISFSVLSPLKIKSFLQGSIRWNLLSPSQIPLSESFFPRHSHTDLSLNCIYFIPLVLICLTCLLDWKIQGHIYNHSAYNAFLRELPSERNVKGYSELQAFFLLIINKNSEIDCISHFVILFFSGLRSRSQISILRPCQILISIFSDLYFLLSTCILLFYVSFSLPQLLWNKMGYK